MSTCRIIVRYRSQNVSGSSCFIFIITIGAKSKHQLLFWLCVWNIFTIHMTELMAVQLPLPLIIDETNVFASNQAKQFDSLSTLLKERPLYYNHAPAIVLGFLLAKPPVNKSFYERSFYGCAAVYVRFSSVSFGNLSTGMTHKVRSKSRQDLRFVDGGGGRGGRFITMQRSRECDF